MIPSYSMYYVGTYILYYGYGAPTTITSTTHTSKMDCNTHTPKYYHYFQQENATLHTRSHKHLIQIPFEQGN